MRITYHEIIPDLETYFELRASVDWNNFSVEQAEKALAGSAYFVLAKDGEIPIAMGRAIGDGMYYVIVDVAVRPEYQGKKIGSTIVNRLVERIQKDAPEGSRVSIQLLAAKGKEEFYVKQGFKILPHEHCGPALRKIIYT
ncbi:GNAT family N-acetyltransferase [Butyrivibrio sp. INlla14]|uniref:GNAT family N-acetyltransferase n=1 Tax=Butyrivibrio sp. INlla14 TaxID=1520808 RepID=UPI000876EDBD|nr:GNAT family N-acetyltransferase [Butyrivibrio sp. INlla14]SCY12785.1 Acetyltransferase (GNAT) domain-containing protein [Butyrivibrio sp. INlla14]